MRRCSYVRSSGLEFSLQAALTLSRLKPELRATLELGAEFRYGVRLQAERRPTRLKPELQTQATRRTNNATARPSSRGVRSGRDRRFLFRVAPREARKSTRLNSSHQIIS